MNKLQRYDSVWPNEKDDGWCVAYEDVQELEAQHAAVCKHMMRMYYALCGLTNPQPDDVYADLMAEAIAAVHAFQNDDSQGVTVELPYDIEGQDNE